MHLQTVVLVISHSTALVTTVLRLVHRFQTRRLWWDDLWAFIALIFDAIVLTLFMVLPPYVCAYSGFLPAWPCCLFSVRSNLFNFWRWQAVFDTTVLEVEYLVVLNNCSMVCLHLHISANTAVYESLCALTGRRVCQSALLSPGF